MSQLLRAILRASDPNIDLSEYYKNIDVSCEDN